MFWVNVVIKGNGRIVNWDVKETDSIRKVLDNYKFKHRVGTVRLNNESVMEDDLDKPLIKLVSFMRWHKNVITFAEPPKEKKVTA